MQYFRVSRPTTDPFYDAFSRNELSFFRARALGTAFEQYVFARLVVAFGDEYGRLYFSLGR